MHMTGGETVRTIDDIEQPLLWIVPFAGLTLITIASLVNMVLHFLPNNSGYILMLVACGLICASVSGFITELIKGRGKYVYVSMSVACIHRRNILSSWIWVLQIKRHNWTHHCSYSSNKRNYIQHNPHPPTRIIRRRHNRRRSRLPT